MENKTLQAIAEGLGFRCFRVGGEWLMMVPRAKAGVFVSLKDQMIEVWWTEPPPGSIHNSQELDTTDPNSLDILAGIVNKVKVLYEQ